jgi:hypothetical protein
MAHARPYRSLLVALCLVGLLAPACAKRTAQSAPVPTLAPTPAPAPPPVVTTGRLATEETLKELVQGKTTREDVRARYGQPREVIVSPGIETFVYYRERTSGLISRSTERYEMLTIRFDARGLLKDYEYRFAGH